MKKLALAFLFAIVLASACVSAQPFQANIIASPPDLTIKTNLEAQNVQFEFPTSSATGEMQKFPIYDMAVEWTGNSLYFRTTDYVEKKVDNIAEILSKPIIEIFKNS